MRIPATIILGDRLDVNMTKNSSTPKLRQNLADVSDAKAKQFLLELANLSEDRVLDHQTVAIFESRYAEIIPGKWRHFPPKPPPVNPRFKSGLLELIDQRNIFLSTPSFRDALRALWLAPDFRTKEWGVFRLIDQAVIVDTHPVDGMLPATFNIVDGHVAPLPPSTALEGCLRYLLRNAQTTVVCANSECPAPFFFASRKSQKYCSPDCALPAQRSYKRKWWANNGKQRRAQRAKRS
jgi:hypothetical protein